MNTKLFTILPALLLSTTLFAQHQIKGSIYTTENKPVDFAEVYLYNSQGEIVQQGFTQENGSFTIDNIPSNTYLLQVLNFNVKQYEQTINVSNNSDLGVITVNTTTQLGEITLQAKTKLIERKIDRTVFNVENSIHATNNDITDLLKLTPSIKVTQDEISIIGKGKVQVMINDKIIQLTGEDLINYLRTIPSDNIKSIEVITTPPAKYEAEGNSGLINIVLKEPKEDSWSNQLSTGIKSGKKAIWRFGDVFNYNKNKWSINAGINGALGDRYTKENAQLHYPDQLWDMSNNSVKDASSISGNILIDYKLSDKTSIGFQYTGMNNSPKDVDNNNIMVYNNVDNLVKKINTSGVSDNVINNNELNAHLNQTIGNKGTKLKIDLDYFGYKNNKNRVFNTYQQLVDNPINNSAKAQSSGNQKIENLSAKIDIDQPLEWVKLNYGAKTSFVTTNNQTSYYDLISGNPIQDLNQTDNFEYKENTQALYVSATKEINSKWQTQIGLRLENTQTIGTSKVYRTEHKNNYTKLFPTIYISYNTNDSNNFSFNYNRRISRPQFWELNPFRWYINEYSYSEGNPQIQPVFTDNFQLSHTFNGNLNTSISYSKSKNNYSQYPLIDAETNVQKYLRDNILDTESYNLFISYSINAFPWLQSQVNGNLFYNTAKLIKDVDLTVKNGWGTYFTTNNTIYLNAQKTFTAQVDYWLQPTLTSSIYKVYTSHALGLGAKYSMLDKKLNISLYINDIFNTGSQHVSTTTNGVYQNYKMNYDNRYLNFGLSYTFGNSKVKVAKHTGGNTEEQNRG
ncbi:MAG: TonB-dependent receptor [Flavobacteriaceae bacterium]|jgi:hypothetical protein|nr:TonB-dependent receptor [Flavobacteriaceae bacterium]